MTDTRQLPLAFEHRPAMGGEDFLVAPCNRVAAAWLDRWPDWPAPALVLYGPAGCGKTHLARVFMARSGARAVSPDDLRTSDPTTLLAGVSAAVLDDAEAVVAAGLEEALLHLYNTARDGGGHLLLTGRRPPNRWGVGLADLASRLNGAAQAVIGAPDDGLLGTVLLKLFADRQLRIDSDVVPYVTARMERSFSAAGRLVAEVDAAALAEGRRITVPFVRRVMGRLPVADDRELLMKILQFGSQAEVLSPQSLRDKVVHELRAMQQLYSSGTPCV